MKKYAVILFLLFISLSFSQTRDNHLEYGYYSSKNYSQEDYHAHFQNWSITQDKNGFIYAGNQEGVLEFDGASWRLISSPGLNAVRTVVVDDNNVKWVGADRELGYLTPDSTRQLQFKSLKEKIPESNPLTANIWRIFAEHDRVIFATDNTLYAWKDQQFSIISHPGPGPINREYQIHGIVYVNIFGEGMFQVMGNTMQLIPNGELLKNVSVTVAIPYGNSSVLFASKRSGIYIYDGLTLNKLENEIEAYLAENLLYAGIKLDASTYAFATLRGGVILMDEHGKHISTITEDEGIGNNQVHGLAVDNHKGLWIAHQTGISKLEPLLPYTFFDKRNGLEGTVTNMLRHKGKLYVGTYSGLYVLNDNAGNKPAKFSKIEEIKTGCFSLLQTDNELFTATANGVYRISERQVSQINTLAGCRTLCRSKNNINRIFVGHMHGLSTIIYKDGKWQAEKDIEQIKEDIFTINTTYTGTLWLGASLNQVIKIDFPKANEQEHDDFFDNLIINKFSEGLPEGRVAVWLINDELYASTDAEGGPLFKFDAYSKLFIPEKDFGKKFGLDSLLIYPRAVQNNGQYILLESKWTNGEQYRFSASMENSNQYEVKRIFDEPVRGNTFTILFWDDKNQLWIGGEEVLKYNLNSIFNFNTHFSAHVRKVIINQDSLIFGGDPISQFKAILKHSKSEIRFEFAAPASHPESNKYQYRLEGIDSNWSQWSDETKKDYTNLPPGNFQFSVRARNIYGDVSKIGTFDFIILAPWYLTWWSYLLYILLFIGFIWAILGWRSRQLKAHNVALEKLIAVRTTEVQHQANQLKIQAEKLQELDKAKSRFFANISHEFRTPLTLIKGPIEQLEQNFSEKLDLDTVKMIRRNANRLLNMVNQLLDLSKIDEGSLKLTPTEGDVYKCLRAASSSFNSQAAQRNIDYKVEIPNTVLWAAFDRDKLENIVYNLLGNAFKFSENDSKISFIADYTDSGLQIQVSDDGKGIPAEKLPHIFDRFYQVDDTSTRKTGGSGIGLSLSKDLVELMKGTIKVSSKVGKGTFFTVLLPIQEIRTKSKKMTETYLEEDIKGKLNPFKFDKTDKRNIPNILLVEDNIDMRHFIKGQLIKFYKVTEALNGADGYKKAIANPPNLVITDLMMPKMDGIELCELLKTDVNTSHIPIIMLTAKAGIENKIEGFEVGADDYLVKPFDVNELLARSKNLITQREKLRQLYTNHNETTIDPKNITVTSIDQKFLEKVIVLLETEFSNPAFGIPQMQDHLAMSKTQLHRKLKALTNEAPGELLRNFRLKRAAQLLLQEADSVTQIAYAVGFNNLSYFAKCFKGVYGVTPSAYTSHKFN